ncbi:CLUMA_CG005964, isoform A [Clunio marinus]|uniref:CLUMA_CG005964, isoform A n=1 Tax=Clunio marinus TaxID=568069 RepID=A0A1J1HWN7_9DIPT|nr:CLUMA_CG005964, isoform A [Clunio marinus]
MIKLNKLNSSDVESDNESRLSTNASETSTNASASAQRSSAKAGRRKSKGKNNANKPIMSLYRFNCFVTEENAKQIFAVQFNHFMKDRNIFATASGYRISIYECIEPKDSEDEGIEDDEDFCGIKLLRAYDDPDRDEVFYTLAWSYEENGSSIIACGGVRSVVRIIYCNGPGLHEKKFIGHTNAINELKFHPTQPHLLLTASKDHSMRLWNVKTDICVAIFGGVSGHRDEVLAIDFDVQGKHVVSGGMDHNLKIWKLETDELQTAIDESATYYDLWFVRMDLDMSQRFLAVGNSVGKIFVFDLESDTPNIKPNIMSHYKATKAIRQIAFSRNSDILVASCDDGKIWRWDKRD